MTRADQDTDAAANLDPETAPASEVASEETGREAAVERPEIVIGLVTPIGTNTADLAASVSGAVATWGYTPRIIKVTDALKPDGYERPQYEDERIEQLIDLGNAWCKSHESIEGLTPLIIQQIRNLRIHAHRARGDERDAKVLAEVTPPATAYIIHSLKRAGEVSGLRETYRDRFFLLSWQESLEKREQALFDRLSTHVNDSPDDRRAKARHLITRDEQEPISPVTAEEKEGPIGTEDPLYQQTMRKAFTRADVFIPTDGNVDRAIALYFGDNTIAPTVGEHAMFVAHSTAARSLTASRRVGAAITSGNSIVATGMNEVPERGGQVPDAILGIDGSELDKRRLVINVVEALAKQGHLSAEWQKAWDKTQSTETGDKPGLHRDQLHSEAVAALAYSGLMDVIEYQRAVHAEMWAILDAAERGVALHGTVMYGTTYPCHLCWKHVFASGITKMYYIDNYPKSRAESMYAGSTSMLQPFIGVAPRAFIRLFHERKLASADASGRIPARTRNIKGVPMVDLGDTPAMYAREAANVQQHADLQ